MMMRSARIQQRAWKSAVVKARWSLSTGGVFRTASTTDDASPSSVASRLSVGGHKWARMDRQAYTEMIHTAVANGITSIEVGQEGGDVIMSEVLSTIAAEHEKESPTDPLPKVTLLQRVGYRTVPTHQPGLEGDLYLETLPKKAGTVQHNLHPTALQSAIYDCYLNHAPSASWKSDRLLMLHNPEVQASAVAGDQKLTTRQAHIRQKLVDAFSYLQEATTTKADRPHNLVGYGVVSNGLGLPEQHPLHLSWTDTVLPALQTVAQAIGDDAPLNFQAVQLPVNLLETTGLDVAQQVKTDQAALDFLQNVQVYAMRPLTCYPDRGTGDGHPFILADYQLPAGMDKTLQWTNLMSQPPAAYSLALKTAMAHFDATEILEAKERGEELSTDQRETLDGCKLLQSLLHDVDHDLASVRSFAQHEADVVERIIPLIHDTFEGYDEDTAQILQSFFGAYALAVRYSMARNTRELLTEGGDDRTAPTYPDLKPEVRLQEYALHFLLKAGTIDKFLVGFSEADQILEDLDIVHKFFLQQEQS
jgi:hypothetical protein